VARLEAGFEWDEELRDKPFKTFFEGEVEPCINALLDPRLPGETRIAH
jgi:hypothetical protein